MTLSISHEIAGSLRDDILRLRYRAGERLPSERDLAARFDTSRGAVRESLTQLEQMGLIKIKPGGARVKEISDASLSILGPLFELDDIPSPKLVDQFLETMGAMVALTAKSAVEKANDDELSRLQQLVVNIAKKNGDFAESQPQWQAFLRLMADVSDNLVVQLIRNDLKAQLLEHMMNLGIRPELRKKVAAKTLNAMKVSFATRNAELAASAMLEHFDELREGAASALQRSLSDQSRQTA